jgi:hypothetical protein
MSAAFDDIPQNHFESFFIKNVSFPPQLRKIIFVENWSIFQFTIHSDTTSSTARMIG